MKNHLVMIVLKVSHVYIITVNPKYCSIQGSPPNPISLLSSLRETTLITLFLSAQVKQFYNKLKMHILSNDLRMYSCHMGQIIFLSSTIRAIKCNFLNAHTFCQP